MRRIASALETAPQDRPVRGQDKGRKNLPRLLTRVCGIASADSVVGPGTETDWLSASKKTNAKHVMRLYRRFICNAIRLMKLLTPLGCQVLLSRRYSQESVNTKSWEYPASTPKTSPTTVRRTKLRRNGRRNGRRVLPKIINASIEDCRQIPAGRHSMDLNGRGPRRP
jgi:hypothetical protein